MFFEQVFPLKIHCDFQDVVYVVGCAAFVLVCDHMFQGKRMEKIEFEDNLNYNNSYEKCYLRVTGMTCASCVSNIERGLSKLEGVHGVLVALLSQKAEIKYDPAFLLPQQLANFLSDMGYPSTVIDQLDGLQEGEVELRIEGMTCSSCVHTIESNIKKLPGIKRAVVSLSTQKGIKYYDQLALEWPNTLFNSRPND